MRRHSLIWPAAIAILPLLGVATPVPQKPAPLIRPVVPTADRSAGNKVFLENAEELRKAPDDSFMVVVRNVVFTKGPMIMKCDSAHYYPDTESMNAYGNVSMEQGDTLFIFADELDFDGPTEIATLYADPGKKVELINRDVKLETDVFVYDLAVDIGYYEVGGQLTDPGNTLVSLKGEYIPSTKEANFYTDVHLNSRNATDTLDIFSDTLYYNTATHVAEIYSPSEIINRRGTIYTTRGVCNTDSNYSILYDRSMIVTSQGQTLTADTIYYDRARMYGEAFGNMIMTDTAHHAEVRGQYGFYNEATDSTFVTGRAMLAEYSQGDTLFLHGRYIETFRAFDTIRIKEDTLRAVPASERIDTSHVAVVYPRVRFFRSDVQGVCDSMRFTSADSTLRMYINPVIWSEDRQVHGNIIEMLLNDSTVERITLPDQGFTSQHIEGDHYNQMSGKEMVAYFVDGDMRRLDINGNVEIILYPEESDSTINKIVNAESSFLRGYFRNRNAESIKLWPETTGKATPLFLAKRSQYFLAKFKWFDAIRPRSPHDIFVIPDEMEEMMRAAGR